MASLRALLTSQGRWALARLLPSVVTSELEQVAIDAIRTAFHPTTPGFHGLIERFLGERERLLKGPYISVALPFRQGSSRNWFPEIPLRFSPYRHQEKAFERLLPGSPSNTLVATGTGSGKTECFLLPVLEHCRQQHGQGRKGVKAILIYPMNALATDQARRIADLIHTIPSLTGLRAGLYIGASDDHPTAAMTAHSVITDKAVLHKGPPDILLTNYKQLDYLLLQPHVQGLWQHNTPSPDGSSVLRYLVVDEFHTFDGAQGTDLACLIRRLRDRLHCRGAALICVGTSATLGGPESRDAMADYAGQIFASQFDADGLIEEERLSSEEFFTAHTAYGDEGLFALPLPGPDCEQQLDHYHFPSASDYLQKQAQLWLDHTLGAPPEGDINNDAWRLELGRRLGTLPAVHNLVRQAIATCSLEELLERFSRQLGLGEQYSRRYRVLVLDSLLALTAHARRRTLKLNGSEVVAPWLNLRQQLWLRELKRMVASVEETPLLKHSDDLSGNDSSAHLPVVHCRECGATAWAATVTQQDSNTLDRATNLQNFYKAYFSDQPELRYLFPQAVNGGDHRLCSDCLSFHKTNDRQPQGNSLPVCPNCSSPALLPVEVRYCTYVDSHNHPHVSRNCPYCHAHQGLLLIGSSAASLTSTWSASLFASNFNHDKKLLTFSDSVQDAAHRAGFIAARTYRTSFRTALTRTVREHGRPISLEQLQDKLIRHWQQKLPNPVDFAATFLPTELEWLKEWDHLQQQNTPTLPNNSFLLDCVNQRLRWEVATEFGYRSRIGSSVEQAGSLAADVDPSSIEALLDTLLMRLQNEIEPLRSTGASQVAQLIVGLLHHWRQRGAIGVPELIGAEGKAGSTYLSSGGTNTFPFNQQWHTPKFGPSASKPLFLTNHRGKGCFEQLVGEKGRPTWSQHWLKRTLKPTQALDADQQSEALHLVVSVLTEAGLLQELPGGGTSRVWAIPRSVIQVQAQPWLVRCECCGDSQSVLPEQRTLWDGMPCLVRHCTGHYCPDSRAGLALYRRLYKRGEVHRIVAREHTGLLERAHRDRLETQFIRGRFRSDPNLLSATSTLEMGINIGDLSSVLLASVPPEPANYLQRIGRAGRRDGNAVIGTIVNGTAHDLYFFADPRTMLQGQVNPPGCYLNAAAILKRQLVAYSLDRWVQSGISDQALPKQLKPVLDAITIKKAGNSSIHHNTFPTTWLSWTQAHQGKLLEDFLALFADNLDNTSRQALGDVFLTRAGVDSDDNPSAPFAQELVMRLEQLIAERKRLTSEARKLRKRYTDFTNRPEESLTENEREAKEEIQRELRAYNSLRKEIDNRQLLAMLTDEGFLPNYAFPEAGVTLKSVLWRKLPGRDRGPNHSEELPPLSYERPANVAIRELVPDGQFYAQGRRVRVDQVDPTLNRPETWRFCPACSFACKSTDDTFNCRECPRCGHSGYADCGQVKEMVKLTQVQATTEDARSRFGDDRDERNPLFFHRELLILPDHQRREITLSIKGEEFPFGAEYLSGTVFREINFGENTMVGSSHEIAGKSLKVRGFELCRSCGKVQRGSPQANNHTWGCQYRDKPDDAQLHQLLFMYREFSSEAVRFLLPGANFWDESGLSSFAGALHLGLRQRFSGKVNHLQSALGDEPQGNQQRKTFLYLFDSVPGGTGYLRQLMEQGGSDLKEVFKQSLDVLQTCSCSDGCYRCIFMYRQRFDREHTSKQRAVEQLQAILEHWTKLTTAERSLSDITINTRAESELELRFIEKLREGKGAPRGVTVSLKSDVIQGRKGYLLSLTRAKRVVRWKLQQQVLLGESEGVSCDSRADFLLTPTAGGKPIAIYTDGWEFHRGRLATDAQQRMALQRSGRFLFWGLSWDDVVEKAPSPKAPLDPNGLKQDLNPKFNHEPELFLNRWWPEELRAKALVMPQAAQSMSSLELLMAYLAEPSETLWQGMAQQFALAQVSQQPLDHPELGEAISSGHLQSHVEEWRGNGTGNRILGQELTIGCGLSVLGLVDLGLQEQTHPCASLRVSHFEINEDLLPEQQQAAWREWLRLGNLFQFLPHGLITTPGWTGAEQPVAVDTPTVWIKSGAATAPSPTPEHPVQQQRQSTWRAIVELAIKECHHLLNALKEPLLETTSLPLPEDGYELIGSRGEVIAQAELAWASHHLAVVVDPADLDTFTQRQWVCWLLGDPPDVIANAILQHLRNADQHSP